MGFEHWHILREIVIFRLKYGRITVRELGAYGVKGNRMTEVAALISGDMVTNKSCRRQHG